MEEQFYIFDPGTNTSKCPFPTDFEHRLGFVDKIERFLTIHNQEDIININKLLESTYNLQISNIISRVIAQVIGEYKDGFVTIKSTEDGQLHVYLAGSDPANPIQVELLEGSAFIGNVKIQGSAREVKRMDIDKASGDNSEVIEAVPTKKLCLVNIAFTISDEADIFLNSDANHMTGEMDFGAANEPRGFVSNNGIFPLKTTVGQGFFIESNTAARIRGFVVYYEE